jgi:hypothetical protein
MLSDPTPAAIRAMGNISWYMIVLWVSGNMGPRLAGTA